MAESAGEKTEEPTQKRRKEAREKGTVAKSVELSGALTLLVASALLPGVVQGIGAGIWSAFHKAAVSAPSLMSPQSVTLSTFGLALPVVLAMMPLLVTICGVGVASQFAQVGFVLSGEAMKPNFDKVNPLQGFKRVFSSRALMEGAKALAKMTVFGWVAYSAMNGEWARVSSLSWLTTAQSSAVVGSILHSVLLRVSMVWLVIAGADYFFQRKSIDKQLRMTKQELKQEMKDAEGSPELKVAIAKRRIKLLRSGMAKKVREADVVITNPTHFAIAVKYDRSAMHAPIVLAKGQDLIALKMREIAKDAKVPIVENKPLARALYKLCEPGDFVPRDLFGPVAEVLAYVYKIAKKR